MELIYRIYFWFGLVTVVYANLASCTSCLTPPLVIGLILGFYGYKPQGGIIILGGTIVPLLVRFILPASHPFIRLGAGLFITLAAWFFLRSRRIK